MSRGCPPLSHSLHRDFTSPYARPHAHTRPSFSSRSSTPQNCARKPPQPCTAPPPLLPEPAPTPVHAHTPLSSHHQLPSPTPPSRKFPRPRSPTSHLLLYQSRTPAPSCLHPHFRHHHQRPSLPRPQVPAPPHDTAPPLSPLPDQPVHPPTHVTRPFQPTYAVPRPLTPRNAAPPVHTPVTWPLYVYVRE